MVQSLSAGMLLLALAGPLAAGGLHGPVKILDRDGRVRPNLKDCVAILEPLDAPARAPGPGPLLVPDDVTRHVIGRRQAGCGAERLDSAPVEPVALLPLISRRRAPEVNCHVECRQARSGKIRMQLRVWRGVALAPALALDRDEDVHVGAMFLDLAVIPKAEVPDLRVRPLLFHGAGDR